MPPQPILSKRRNATVTLDPAAVNRYPAMGTHIAEIIALWARIESHLGSILAFMLKGGVRASIAMYDALVSSQAQMAAIEAAARTTLNPEDFRLFGAILTLVKRAGAKRHKIAHWIWGYSPELQDCLVLVDPDAILEYSTNSSEWVSSVQAGSVVGSAPKLDLTKAFAYTSSDFAEILNELRNVQAITIQFMLIASNVFPDDRTRSALLALPQIREALRQTGG